MVRRLYYANWDAVGLVWEPPHVVLHSVASLVRDAFVPNHLPWAQRTLVVNTERHLPWAGFCFPFSLTTSDEKMMQDQILKKILPAQA